MGHEQYSGQREQIRCYKDLRVWQRAMDLVVSAYQLTEAFPRTEMYGLSSQLQRAAVSIPANIAEGHGREHTKEYMHHLSIANGSLTELETHVEIALRLRYITDDTANNLKDTAGEVSRLLTRLRQALQRKINTDSL